MVSDRVHPNGKTFVKDEGGAIMIMGLAMILGLIAFLWFLLGIGETLAFRDHMQDSADSAAFSQAAVEAAGMNLIVLLNLLIMLLVIVYLIASVVITLSWIALVVCAVVTLGACLAVDGPAYVEEWNGRNRAAKVLSYIDMGLSIFESGVAVLAPWAGTGAGIDASTSYKMKSMTGSPWGLSVSSNNFPDLSALSSLGRALGVDYGLPVTHEILGNDCAHVIDWAGDALASLLPGKISGMIDKGVGTIGAVAQWYYCDNSPMPDGLIKLPSGAKKVMDFLGGVIRLLIGGGDGADYWVSPGYGPMENYKHVEIKSADIKDAAKPTHDRHKAEWKNGADHNQSYSFLVVPSSYSDHHAMKNIKFMQLHNAGWSNGADTAPTTMVGAIFYFAQAELYLDCDKGWNSPKCDDPVANLDHFDLAVYQFAWRARLVKVHAAEGSTIGKILDVVNKGLSMVTDVKGWINGSASNPFIKGLQFLDQLTGINILGFIGSIADIPPTQIFH